MINSVRIFNAYGGNIKTSELWCCVGILKQKIEKKPFTLVGDGSRKILFM